MTTWQVAAVASGCVFAMVPAAEVSMSRICPTNNPDNARATLRRLPRGWLMATVLLGVMVAASGARPRLILVVAAGLVLSVAGRRVVRLTRLRRRRRERQRQVVALCDALSAELRGGLPMATAVRRSCRPERELEPVVAAAELGGDIAEALRTCAGLPGAEGLRAVAAAWDVAGSSGSALAVVLDRIARGLRDDDDARAEVLAALGPPRATARLLAVLPLFGLGLGASIGAHPVEFMTGTSWGLVCLFGGAGLALIGLWWVEQLAATAEV